MAVRFQKRISLCPGISINLGRRGASLSIGPRGARTTIGSKGVKHSIGVPGSGIRYETPYKRSFVKWIEALVRMLKGGR